MGIEDQYLEEFGAVGSVTAAAQNKQRLWFREVFVADEVGSTATTWATQATLYLGTPSAGKFLVNWSFEATNTTTNKGCDTQVLCNGSTVMATGTTRPSTGGIWTPVSGSYVVDVDGTAHNCTVQYRAWSTSGGVGTAKIRNIRMCGWRVA